MAVRILFLYLIIANFDPLIFANALMINRKIKVSAVSYLNSKPLIYGLMNNDEIDLSLDIPSVCANKLLNDEVDIGLIPIAILPLMKEYFILTDYCIGADGAVSSVNLYSEVPLDKIENILLDYQSRTSVMLCKVLAKYYWKINPNWINADDDFEQKINGTTAAVIIGDRTFDKVGVYKNTFDLSLEWKNFTGLPFVFACWVANKKLPDDFVESFNKTIAFGIEHKEAAIQEWIAKSTSKVDVREYLEKYISYPLNHKKRQGMELFLNYCATI
jgi:chorismate dehydratase